MVAALRRCGLDPIFVVHVFLNGLRGLGELLLGFCFGQFAGIAPMGEDGLEVGAELSDYLLTGFDARHLPQLLDAAHARLRSMSIGMRLAVSMY